MFSVYTYSQMMKGAFLAEKCINHICALSNNNQPTNIERLYALSICTYAIHSASCIWVRCEAGFCIFHISVIVSAFGRRLFNFLQSSEWRYIILLVELNISNCLSLLKDFLTRIFALGWWWHGRWWRIIAIELNIRHGIHTLYPLLFTCLHCLREVFGVTPVNHTFCRGFHHFYGVYIFGRMFVPRLRGLDDANLAPFV